MRLGTALKSIGYACLVLFGILFLLAATGGAHDSVVSVILEFLFVRLPGCGFWVVGWVVQGFAKD